MRPERISHALTFVQDDFVSEYLDVEFAIREKTIQDVPAGLASGLDVQGTHADEAQWRGFRCWTGQPLPWQMGGVGVLTDPPPSPYGEASGHCLDCGC